jgi:IgGFc binding protein
MTMVPHHPILGDASNGCSPDVTTCTNANDILKAGDSIVIQDTVFIQDASYGKTITYDGGDRIVASAPITVVRGGYPTNPGSLMAGSVEVIDVGNWGTTFEAPVGRDIGEYFAAFEFARFFFMAACNNTEVTLPNGKVVILNQGESGSYAVNQGDKLSSTEPIQVDFITGDESSYYELRWFSSWPTSTWSNSYVTPVGDTFGKTKLLLYNPNAATILVDVITLVGGVEVKKTETIKKGKATLTNVIPTDSGAIVVTTGGESFVALSFTDTEYRTTDGQITSGQWLVI